MKRWLIGSVILGVVLIAGFIWYLFQNNPKPEPKEAIRLSGYAMTDENGDYLKEATFSLLGESDNEIETIKTDDEGYFCTRLAIGKNYRIKGDQFAIQIKATGVNKYEINSESGYLLLGKRLEDEISTVVYKPSVFYLKNQINYTYSSDQQLVRLEERVDLEEGDIISLPPTETYLTGYILRVKSVEYEEDMTLVTVVDDVTAKEALQEATLDGEFNLSEGYILTRENVSFFEKSMENMAFASDNQEDSSLSYTVGHTDDSMTALLAKDKIEDGVSAKWKKIKDGRAVELSYEMEDNTTAEKLTFSVSLEGTVKTSLDFLKQTASIESSMKFKYEITSYVSKVRKKEKEIPLATIYIPTSTGLGVPVNISFIFSANGDVQLSLEESEEFMLNMVYEEGKADFIPNYKGERSIELKATGELETGLKESSKVEIAQLEILEVYAKAPVLEVEGEIGLGIEQKDFEEPITKNVSGKFSARIGLDVGIYTDLWEIDEEEFERELLSFTWKNPEELYNKWKSPEELYKIVFDDYIAFLEKVRTNSDFDNGEIWSAAKEMAIPIHDWVAESIWRNKNTLRYAFCDIDKNGTMELLTAAENSDGSTFLYGVYYINDGTPTLLTEGFVGGTAARSAVNIYTDGTILGYSWSSGTGDGGGTLYKLQKDNTTAIEVESKEFTEIYEMNINELFGKSDKVLDLSNLEWKKFEQ